MINNLLRDNKEQLYLVLDSETCSLNCIDLNNKIWQLSYLICKGDKILEEHDYHLKWDNLVLSEGAARITGFDKRKYDRLAVEPMGVWINFSKYLYDPKYIKLFTNGFGFDIYMIKLLTKNLGVEHPWSYLDDCIDTSALYKMIKLGVTELKRNEYRQQGFKFIDYVERGLKSSISASCKELEIDYDPNMHHDGLYDTKKTWDIWRKLVYKIDI